MAHLLSAGIDIGTTTTQLVFSRLTLRDNASPWQTPDLRIAEKTVIYRSPVVFTPLLDRQTIDAEGVAALIRDFYRQAAVEPEQVQTGAVIITGETARKSNADAVVRAISHLAGDFVVEAAGPALEGVLAGLGAGCDRLSQRGPVLNLDMGGGTTNLALFAEGRAVSDGCLNVGGRLLAYDRDHRLGYLSPVLEGLCDLRPGQQVGEPELLPVARLLTQVLEQALGLAEPTLLPRFITDHPLPLDPPLPRLSFTGGVGACLKEDRPWDAYGDLGPLLARCIRRSPIWGLPRVEPVETIRATVVGAGSHATCLSGSTVFARNVALPLKNLPVIALSLREESLPPRALADCIQKRRQRHEGPVVIAFSGESCRSFGELQRLAAGLSLLPGPIYTCTRLDCAKALGQSLVCTDCHRSLLCLDGLEVSEGSYLDVGRKAGEAFPVVIKTLLLG